jgi:Saxitoxin biosynthesis operon protein SxtJ
MSWIEQTDFSPKKVRNFGFLFGCLGLLAAIFLFYRHRLYWPWVFSGTLFLFITALWGYPILRPIYAVWMSLAYLMAWINTKIILGLLFYLVMTPIGLALRLIGKDLLDQKSDRTRSSYWIKKDGISNDRERYRHQF